MKIDNDRVVMVLSYLVFCYGCGKFLAHSPIDGGPEKARQAAIELGARKLAVPQSRFSQWHCKECRESKSNQGE